MSGLIQLRLRHLSTEEADAVWAAVQTEEGSDLADNLAVTIASWWQSPGSIGRALAALASGAPIDAARLAQDIDATIAELRQHQQTHPPEEFGPGPTALEVLGWLRSWADDWTAR